MSKWNGRVTSLLWYAVPFLVVAASDVFLWRDTYELPGVFAMRTEVLAGVRVLLVGIAICIGIALEVAMKVTNERAAGGDDESGVMRQVLDAMRGKESRRAMLAAPICYCIGYAGLSTVPNSGPDLAIAFIAGFGWRKIMRWIGADGRAYGKKDEKGTT